MKNFKIQCSMLHLFLVVLYLTIFVNYTFAQTVDPLVWQNNAVGLKTTSNSYKKTAGLIMTIYLPGQTSWPFLLLQGGVEEGWGKLKGPIGIDLGEIKIPNISASTNTETSSWSSNEISINAGALKTKVSRLSPALLVQTTASKLRLFSGNVRRYSFNGTTLTNLTPGPSYPKYIAYSSGGIIQVKQLSTTSFNLPTLDNSWILIWYGNNSHFADTKKPLTYSHGMLPYRGSDISVPMNQAYLADVPILMIFQNNPTAIVHSAEGGIELTFSSSPGYGSLLPIYGREHLRVSDTETWGSTLTLPSVLQGKINFWTQRLCQYPTSVSETYSYDSAIDQANITENIIFTPICAFSSGKFASLPPMLSVAKDAFSNSLSFSGTVINGNIPTEFGPVMGIDGVTEYTWSLKGLRKYTDAQRVYGSGSVPVELIGDLVSYTDKLTAAGHLAPWIFGDGLANVAWNGRIYFNNPGDTLYYLSEVAHILPEPQKTNLINYLKQERASYPPETHYSISLTAGSLRDFYSLNPSSSVSGATSITDLWTRVRPDAFLNRVPLYNFLALSRYYDLTGETIPATVVSASKTVLNTDMSEQDWATMSWFIGYEQRHTAVENINRHFAGLVGATKLFKQIGDGSHENLTRSLLAKAAVARIAMAVYPRYLYSNNLEDIAGYAANWQVTQTAGTWYGTIFNYSWRQPEDDIRQVARLNQFEAVLYDHQGYGNPDEQSVTWNQNITVAGLSPFLDIIPELGRLLGDYVKHESITYISKVQELIPHWHIAYGEAVLGSEHSRNHPTDAYQLLMAKSLIQGETAGNLEKKVDIPWLTNGDLFYMNKAAEAVKAYKGWTWADSGATTSVPNTPTPIPSVPGDVNGDGVVNLTDLAILLSNFGKSGMTRDQGDLNGDQIVNLSDLSTVLANFGKSG